VRIRVALLALGLVSVVVGCALVAVPLGFIVGGLASAGVSLYWPYKDGD
jgi:hypothetical protein